MNKRKLALEKPLEPNTDRQRQEAHQLGLRQGMSIDFVST